MPNPSPNKRKDNAKRARQNSPREEKKNMADKDCHIIHAPGSDHCAVKLFIQSDSLNKKAGPGFWKFNSSFLEDESYNTELKEKIKIYRNKY